MNWNYEEKLTEYIAQAQNDSGVGQGFVFHVYTEQVFAKQELKPDEIYVVIKYLSTDNTLNATTRPIQIIVLCEQNQLQETQIIFSKLVETHNFETGIYDTTYIKQDYRDPVVLSNFNEVSYGYRSIIYISATLFVMENVIDVKNVKVGFDNIFLDLNAEEIGLKNDLFSGQYGYPTSLKYVLEIKYASNILVFGSPITFSYYGWLDGAAPETAEGYLLVNGIQCAKIVILKAILGNVIVSLYDVDNNLVESFTYGITDFITIQFMDTTHSIITSGSTGGDYYTNIVNSITQYHYKNAYEENIKPINFNIAYSMTPNTQPIPPERIATSVKSVATFSISFTTAMTSEYKYIDYVSNIMSGVYSGNINFYISFDLGDVHFVRVPMKLISAQLTTAIDQVPGLQIGLLK